MRTALFAVAALSVAAGLGVVNDGNPWGSLLIMGTVAGLSGLESARGLQSAVSMVPIAAAFIVTQPHMVTVNTPAVSNAIVVALLMACSGAWGMLVTATVMRTIHFPAVDPTPARDARILAILLAIVAGVAPWFVADLNLGHGGAWLLMTIIIVMRPGIRITFVTGVQRALGECRREPPQHHARGGGHLHGGITRDSVESAARLLAIHPRRDAGHRARCRCRWR